MHDDLKLQGAFSWSELMTRDVRASVRFYRDLFGWDMIEMPMNGEPYYVANVAGEGIAGIMGMPAQVPPEVPAFWGTYITVFDVDAVSSTVVPLGGNIIVPPTDIPGVGRFCTIQDPHGGMFSLISYEEDPVGGQAPAVYVHGSITWSGLQSRNPSGSAAFLSNLLGVDLEQYTRGGLTYFVIQPEDESGGTTGDLAEPFQPKNSGAAEAADWMHPDDPPFWLTCVKVNDVDVSTSRAKEFGATVVSPPMDIPDVGRVCTIMDPQGAVISMITYLPPRD